MARIVGVQLHGPLSAPAVRHMVDEIDGEPADQVDGEHSGLKGRAHFRPIGDLRAVGAAVLAAPVDSRGAHQIADLSKKGGVRLSSGGKAVCYMLEQAHTLVAPGQRQFARQKPAGLLSRRIGAQTLDVRSGRHAVEQRERGVPDVRDHAIGSLFRLDPVCERDQAVGSLRGAGSVDRNTESIRVEIESPPFQLPVFPVHASDELAHEAQPGLQR